jgi:hypothetical protein
MSVRRPGITLIEVLVALFVTAVGTLALLVLFPLGALNMARALKDDRAGTLAANAHAMAAARDLDLDPSVRQWLAATPPPGPPTWLAPDPGGPGYPALIDPYFVLGGLATDLGAVPGQTPGIRRLIPDYIRNDPAGPALATDRWFSLLDDTTFRADGRPKLIAGGSQLERQGYYTLSYLIRRQKTALPASAELTVIVYSGRPVTVPQPEQVYAVTPRASAGARDFVLTWTAPQGPPALRRGGWLMDVSYEKVTRNGVQYGFLHGDCYRVTDATLLGATMRVEVQDPVPPGRGNGSVRNMVVLGGAVEVFQRGLLK